MRKNKTWEITLTNNSRLVANEPIENAVVYTTDTEAYLNFRVIDSGFEFDSATIAMLNKDDGSIVERPMTKEDDTAVYEIESDIIPHFGLWQAQVLFKQGEEIFTSTPVTFVIERYMMAEQPPRLEDVVSWKGLYDNATETIQELTRINDELNATNQNVEQAEAQRATAESSRASAEAQREIDHANRSAELAGKADKVVLRNLVVNGDFSDGLSGWNNYLARLSYTDNNTHASFNNVVQSGRIMQRVESTSSANLYYVGAYIKTDSLNVGVGNGSSIVSPHPADGQYHIVSTNNTLDSGWYSVVSHTLDNSFDVQWVVVINLTQTFGAGNEPSKEDMDEIIKFTGHIDGEYALNNKEMLGHLMKGIGEKANKKQEGWITPTLLGGAIGSVAYLKDEFGFVHFKGRVSGAGGLLTMFVMPPGYRPDMNSDFMVFTSTDAKRVRVNRNGNVDNSNSQVFVELSSVIYKAEG